MCSPLCSPEPHAGFKIAFNMFDADGNQMVDKREFLVVSLRYWEKIWIYMLILTSFIYFCYYKTVVKNSFSIK